MKDTAMLDSSNKIDPHWAWEPYRPSDKAPWDLRRVGHLYRRAAFGATVAELEAGLKNGPSATIAALLKGGDGLEDFDRRMQPLADTIARSNDAVHLRS